MVNINAKLDSRLVNIFLAGFIFIFLLCGGTSITHAVAVDTPDVVITINKEGKVTREGDLFGDKLWYPGMKNDGLIRIVNQGFRKFELSELGLGVTLIDYQTALNKKVVYDAFLDHMKLTLEKGQKSVFNKVLFENKSLSDLLDGFPLEGPNDFVVRSNSTLDLGYTLLMDKCAGNELENVTAKIEFLMRAGEKVDGNGNGNGNNGNGDNGSSNNGGNGNKGQDGDRELDDNKRPGDADDETGAGKIKEIPGHSKEEAGLSGDGAKKDIAPSGYTGGQGQLPYTGGSYLGFVLSGLGLIAGGWFIKGYWFNRRK